MKEIPLTQGKVALVDDQDYERLSAWKWFAWKAPDKKVWYAVRSVRRDKTNKNNRMHRYLLNVSRGAIVDHRDGNGLNNQRSNLRVCTNHQNCANQRQRANESGFKGVRRNGSGWGARISVNYRRIILGTFKTREDAARAYDAAALEHYGEFARINYPAPETVTA